MNLFIDTNVFLSFYHFTKDDLEEIQKLVVLIDNEDVTLWLTEQVKDEFARNRESKLHEAMKKLRDQQKKAQFPQICKGYEEFKEICNLQKEYQDLLTSLVNKVADDVYKRTLKADTQISFLFEKAKFISTSKELASRAQHRVSIGNPPGKNGSLGDSINWEALLENLDSGENLYLIADDKDYYSMLDNSKIKDFLYDEWREKKSADVVYYQRLSLFFNDHYPQIKLAAEYELDSLIRELSNSPSFWRTHYAIEKLGKYSNFDEQQVNQLVDALLNNNQITRIICDDDVLEFYEGMHSKYRKKIADEKRFLMEELFQDCIEERDA